MKLNPANLGERCQEGVEKSGSATSCYSSILTIESRSQGLTRDRAYFI